MTEIERLTYWWRRAKQFEAERDALQRLVDELERERNFHSA